MDARLYSTENGQIIRKVPENEFIIEFGNVSWKLTGFQFKVLRDFVSRINGKYFEELNRESFYRRKIRIPIKGTSISILLYQEELLDLKKLLNGVPEEFYDEDDLFDALLKISEDVYERHENLFTAKLIKYPHRLHLN